MAIRLKALGGIRAWRDDSGEVQELKLPEQPVRCALLTLVAV